MAIVEGDFGHPALVDGSVTALHSHSGDLTRVGALYPGVLSTGIKSLQMFYAGNGFATASLRCRVSVPSAGADIKVKFRRNGSYIQHNGADAEVTITAGQNAGTLVLSSSVAVSDGDYFDIEITQVGTAPNEGQDLVWIVVP